MKIPALPLLSKTSPQNTCFLIIACTVLTPLFFSLIQKVLISHSLNFLTSLSLATCRGDSLILGFKHSPPRNISRQKKKCLVQMVEQKNSHPLHFPQHLFILLSVLQKPHKLLFPFVFLLHPLSSRCFCYTLTLSLLCCLSFHPLQVVGYS